MSENQITGEGLMAFPFLFYGAEEREEVVDNCMLALEADHGKVVLLVVDNQARQYKVENFSDYLKFFLD